MGHVTNDTMRSSTKKISYLPNFLGEIHGDLDRVVRWLLEKNCQQLKGQQLVRNLERAKKTVDEDKRHLNPSSTELYRKIYLTLIPSNVSPRWECRHKGVDNCTHFIGTNVSTPLSSNKRVN